MQASECGFCLFLRMVTALLVQKSVQGTAAHHISNRRVNSATRSFPSDAMNSSGKTIDKPLQRTTSASSTGIAVLELSPRPKMPAHWTNEYPDCPLWTQPLLKLTFSALCMISFGSRTLQRRWDIIANEEEHDKYMRRISDRLVTLTLVVHGLGKSERAATLSARRRRCCSLPSPRSSQRPRQAACW